MQADVAPPFFGVNLFFFLSRNEKLFLVNKCTDKLLLCCRCSPVLKAFQLPVLWSKEFLFTRLDLTMEDLCGYAPPTTY